MRRIRFQFGLRTLLLSSTIFAAVFGITEKKAVEQRQLKQSIYRVSGSFRLAPSYQSMPTWISNRIGEDRSMHVVSVNILGYHAPNYELDSPSPYALVSPTRLERLLRLPAMDHVTELKILGTSITVDVGAAITELPNLEKLDLQSTMLVQDDVERISQRLPDCEINHSTMAHVTHPLTMEVPREILPDLSVFSRARDGDLAAIDELIDISGKWNRPRFAMMVSTVLRSIEGREARQRILDGLAHESAFARLVVLRGMKQKETEVETSIVEACLYDPDVAVRQRAVEYATEQHLIDLLKLASLDADDRIRRIAEQGMEVTNKR